MDLNGLVFPSPQNETDIHDFDGEVIFIPKKNNTHVPCLFLPTYHKKISKNFLIFFHGNAEDIFLSREMGDKLRYNLSINVLIVEYPGYSIYKENKSSDIVLDDCLHIFDYLVETLKIDPDYMYIFGRSIGTGPSVYLSSKRKPAGLILMSPFTSVRAVAENIVGNLLKFVVSERFTNIEYIKDVTCPILFIHGQKDTLIPFTHSIKLKDVCNCPYELILPEEMNHNEFDYENDLFIPMKEFLSRHTAYSKNETSEIIIPVQLFETPDYIQDEYLNKLKNGKEGIFSCFKGEAK